MLHEAEELAEPTRAHLWNKGIEIQSNLCTVVSYETHCYIYNNVVNNNSQNTGNPNLLFVLKLVFSLQEKKSVCASDRWMTRSCREGHHKKSA